MKHRSSSSAFIMAVVAALVTSLCASPPARAEGEAFKAMQRLNEGDEMVRSGRTGLGHSVYLELLEKFPTWWLPAVKAAATALEIGLPIKTARTWVELAASAGPAGPYVPLVAFLVDAQDPDATPRPLVFDFGRALWVDRANRLDLARGMQFERSGDFTRAEQEYRRILGRSPLCTTARFRLSRVLAAGGRAGEAARILEEGAGTSLFPPRWRAVAGRDRSRK